MKKIFYFVWFIALLFNGCKPDSDTPCRAPRIYSMDFSQGQLSNITFAGNRDTIGYTNNAGDSITCLGVDKLSWFKTFPVKNNPLCPDDSVGFPINRFTYSDVLSKLIFTVTAYKYDTVLDVTVNSSLFRLPLQKIGVNDSLTYFDSLQFGKRMFYHITACLPYLNPNGDSLYYNASFGMIAMKLGSQHFYIHRFNNK